MESSKIHQKFKSSSDLLGLIACLEVLSGGFTACLGIFEPLQQTLVTPLVSCVNWGNPTMDTHWHRCSFPSSHQSWPYKMLCILHPECQMLCWHPVSNMIRSVQLHYRSLPSPKHNNPYIPLPSRKKKNRQTSSDAATNLFDTINEAMHVWNILESSGISGESCQVPKHSWAALQNHVPGNMNESCHPSHVLVTTLAVCFFLGGTWPKMTTWIGCSKRHFFRCQTFHVCQISSKPKNYRSKIIADVCCLKRMRNIVHIVAGPALEPQTLIKQQLQMYTPRSLT